MGAESAEINTSGWSVDEDQVRVKNIGVEPTYTETQGQYLAFIYYYTKIHG
ncbi:MAG: hypothetical protein ABSF95_18680 [Verrucomicrobiota bacterium]|jgi:hypothetical protein